MDPSGASAVDINPAALAEVDGLTFTYADTRGPDESLDDARRRSLWAALSLGRYGGLGAGFQVARFSDALQPDHGSFVLSGALATDPCSSLGATWRMRFPRGSGGAVHTADIFWMSKPLPQLALLVGGQNLAVNEASLQGSGLIRRGVLGVGVRPFGDARLGLEVLGGVSRDKDYSVRGQASVYVPYLGELLLSGELGDYEGSSQWLLSAGARVVFGNAAVGGATLANGDLGELGYAVWADFTPVARPGVPRPKYIAEVEIAGGARGIPMTLRRLEHALYDREAVGVVLKGGGEGVGLSAAQELRLVIETLEKAGKPVYCYLETASGPQYYACAGASRVTLDPAGNVRLMGVAAESLLLGDLLRKLGLRADFVRIGRYKSAPEQWTNRHPSEGAKEQRTALLDDAYRRLSEDLARDFGETPAQVRARIDQGPYTTQEALDSGLVQAAVDPTEVKKDAQGLFGERIAVRPLKAPRVHRGWGATPQIGVVLVDGTIVDGENVDLPFLDIHMSGGRTVSQTIDAMAGNSRIKAIVLRVDSPGGAVMASDQIWRAVRRAAKKKPVVASLGSVAASGGYYIASAADEIWAAPSTITGSIGIFYGKIDAQGLAEKLDVGVALDSRGANAGAESLYRPFTPEERATLATKLRFWYRQFLERVAEGRSMEVSEVDAVARGHVYSGDRAVELKLVDELGGFTSALARARELAGMDERVEMVVRPERPSTLLDYVLGAEVQSRMGLARVAAPWIEGIWLLGQLSGQQPVALWEGPVSLQ